MSYWGGGNGDSLRGEEFCGKNLLIIYLIFFRKILFDWYALAGERGEGSVGRRKDNIGVTIRPGCRTGRRRRTEHSRAWDGAESEGKIRHFCHLMLDKALINHHDQHWFFQCSEFSVHHLEMDVFPCHDHQFGISRDHVPRDKAWTAVIIFVHWGSSGHDAVVYFAFIETCMHCFQWQCPCDVLWLSAIPDVSFGDQKSLVSNGLVYSRIQQTVSNGGSVGC